jgi:Carboxypeptidase regulatory-like domain/TonB dependent receptor
MTGPEAGLRPNRRWGPWGVRSYLLLAVFGSLFFITPKISAQTEAEITGRVTDTSGAVVPSASVTIANLGTGAKQAVLSDSSGVYDVPDLLPGSYSVTVERSGFQTIVRRGIVLQVQQMARLNFTLQVGAVTKIIQVTANASQMNTENATVGNVVENQRIVGLPLNGRNLLQLTALQANVTYGFGENGTAAERIGGTRAEMDISVAGGRGEWNYFTLDGVSNTDVSYNTYTFLPSIDAVQEFKIQTGVFPAEYGRGFDQVNISTISGTNALHGSLFEFVRNSSTDALSYCFSIPCVPSALLHQNQFGFTVGGPVYIPKVFNGRNKLFFMANYEGFRFTQGQSYVGDVPTTAERAGDFAGLLPIYDPATHVLLPDGAVAAQPFAGNIIPQDRFNPDAVKLLQYFPEPTGPGVVNNYADVLNDTEDDNQFTARIDYDQSSKSRWFGRYSFSNENSIEPQDAIIQGNLRLTSHPKQFVLSNIRTISPTTLNQFWFGYNRLNNQILNWDSGNSSANAIAAIGMPPGVATPTPLVYGVPSLYVSGLTSAGDNDATPFLLYHNTFQYRDVLSMVRGNHSIDVGAEIRRDQDTTEGNSFLRGAFTFDGTVTRDPAAPLGTTGVPFADYMLGEPEEFCGAAALAQAQLRSTDQSYFAQDTWKVSAKLTINMGLRYDYYEPWTEKHDHIVNVLFPAPDTTNQPILVMPGSGNFYDNLPVSYTYAGGLQAIRSNIMGPATYFTSKDGFQPRFGIAYSPTSKWVIRTGFGMFDVLDMQDINFDPSRSLSARRQVDTNADFPNLTFEQPYGGGAGTFTVTAPFSYAADEYMQTPYVFQYLFDVQRQISPNLMIDVGYLGNAGHHEDELLDLNDPLPGPGPVQSRRPFPSFGVIQTNSDDVNSDYNALSARVEKRFSHGLDFVESYTWGRAIDDMSSVRDHTGDTLFPQNPYNPMADRGLSNFQLEQRSATSLVYDLPVGKGRALLGNIGGVANAFLGGWELTGIITVQSGFPYDMNSGVDSANIGESGYERPNYTGQNVYLPNPGPTDWFNTAAFTTPPAYTFGDVGRNTLIGPGLADADISLMKNFYVHENDHFQFRFETFNTLNHPNWGAPTTEITSPGFGTITSTNGNMRELQFGLKFYF